MAASEDLKRIVARELAHGESIATIARRHDYTWKGMKKLSEAPDVRRLVAEERQAVHRLADQHRAGLVLLGGPALKNIAAAVENSKHPKCLEMSRFVIEKILPSRSAVSADVRVEESNLEARARVEIDEAFKRMQESLKRFEEMDPENLDYRRHLYTTDKHGNLVREYPDL